MELDAFGGDLLFTVFLFHVFMQVGIIHEMIGDGAEAETYLRWGKTIACSLQLPSFIVAFSTLIGMKSLVAFSPSFDWYVFIL